MDGKFSLVISHMIASFLTLRWPFYTEFKMDEHVFAYWEMFRLILIRYLNHYSIDPCLDIFSGVVGSTEFGLPIRP